MMRALIVDDEAPARRRLRTLLAREPDVEVVGESADGPSAVQDVAELRPDLMFLDVQMPEMDGFEVLAAIGVGAAPVIVFVTAYERYALDAFDAEAVDYLLKPFANARFARALQRARHRLGSHADAARSRAQLEAVLETLGRRNTSRIAIKVDGRVHVLDVNAIDRVEGARNYVRVFTKGRGYLVRDSLKSWAARLGAYGFIRIHQSHIVNLDRVVELRPWSHGEYVVVLHDGTRLNSSRTCGDELRRALGLSEA
ncbi:MAG: LytR/AlgR family response regulator transcription factor [Longimicrobiales bacterium]